MRTQCLYCEPFSGGAGVAIELLLNNKVHGIILNDFDIGIYSIWKAILDDTNDLSNWFRIHQSLWKSGTNRRKFIPKNGSIRYILSNWPFRLTLNRTNRSGIVLGGPIGGYSQKRKKAQDWLSLYQSKVNFKNPSNSRS